MRFHSSIAGAALILNAIASTPARSGWEALPNAPAGPRNDDLFFIDESTGWVVTGSGGEIWKTTDGGIGWTLQEQLEDTYLRAVGFANASLGWVGTLDPVRILYATTDGGNIWTEVQNIPEPRPTGICGISVVNEFVAYACGRYNGPARLIKTTDGGSTWTSQSLVPFADNLVDCYFTSETTGFIVGAIGTSSSTRRAVVLATTDGGMSWQTRHTSSRPRTRCWKISFPSPQIGYVSLENDVAPYFFLKTTDGGLTWEEKSYEPGFTAQGIGFATANLGWMGGYLSHAYESTDGGDSWHSIEFGDFLNRVRMLSATIGYAAGSTVYKYEADPSGIESAAESQVSQLDALPNYPNPFRDTTRIVYTLGGPSATQVTVHDPAGTELFTLFSGLRSGGRHELVWDGRDPRGQRLPAGVYFYRIDAEGAVSTRKVVVVP